MTGARWWVISDDAFRDALIRAHAGDDPDLILIEQYANSEIEDNS